MNDPELDDRIRRALHAEAAPDQLARLESAWRRHSAAARRRRQVCLAAIAASVAVVAVGGWLASQAWQPSGDRQIVENAPPRSTPPQPKVKKSPAPVLAHETAKLQVPSSSGRPPSDFEQLAFAAQARRSPAAEQALHTAAIDNALMIAERDGGFAGLAEAARKSPDPRLRLAVYKRLLAARSEESVRAYLLLVASESLGGEALAAINPRTRRSTDIFMELLHSEERTTRLAAALVLGRMNGPEITERLIALVTGPDAAPAEAWVALVECRGESADRFLAVASQHPRLLGHVNNARLLCARMMP